MSAEIIELWKLNDSADVTTIDFNGSFTIPATSSSRFETVCPVRQLGTGPVFRRKTARAERLTANRSVSCGVCEAEAAV